MYVVLLGSLPALGHLGMAVDCLCWVRKMQVVAGSPQGPSKPLHRSPKVGPTSSKCRGWGALHWALGGYSTHTTSFVTQQMSWICPCRHHLLGEGLKLFVSPAPPQSLKTLIMVQVGKVIASFLFLTISLNLPMTCPEEMQWVDFDWMPGTHMPLITPFLAGEGKVGRK